MAKLAIKSDIRKQNLFGQIKECGKFRRLRLKGITRAKIDFGLKVIAHNLRKTCPGMGKILFFEQIFVF